LTAPGSSAAGGDLVFIGDVHLDRADPHLEDFLAFLGRLEHSASRVVLMGDLFNVWIGQRALEQPHQRAVLAALADLRARGIVVRYVEGNRDFHIAREYLGVALDQASLDGVSERFAGHEIRAIHGDLANAADRRYRLWRRVSRSWPFWAGFNLLTRRRRVLVAESMERRLRASNLDFKREFPEREVRAYGSRFLEAGYDTVVLGHFHVERDLEQRAGGRPGRIFVLPDWKSSRRHLRVGSDGSIGFVDSGSEASPAPGPPQPSA
jgi:UDP-2,3-diacylglucosamine hydrolase